MTPYYDEAGITIYHGDCLDVLRSSALSFDTVVGDPPYCSGGRQQAQARGIIEKASDRESDWFITDMMGSDSYVWWIREIAGELIAKADHGAHAYLFTDWRQYTNVVTACETKGWSLRNVVVWDKAKGGAMGSFWRNNHEWIPVLCKGKPRAIERRDCFNTWRGTKPQGGEHPTMKPPELIAYLLSVSNAKRVIDPWMGSGTTLLSAKREGIAAIGIEIEERYCEIAAKRLAQGVLPLQEASA